jgi:predicted small secreted protein
MKNTLRVLGIIAFVAVMVFTVVSCGNDMGGSGSGFQAKAINGGKGKGVS